MNLYLDKVHTHKAQQWEVFQGNGYPRMNLMNLLLEDFLCGVVVARAFFFLFLLHSYIKKK